MINTTNRRIFEKFWTTFLIQYNLFYFQPDVIIVKGRQGSASCYIYRLDGPVTVPMPRAGAAFGTGHRAPNARGGQRADKRAEIPKMPLPHAKRLGDV